MLNLNNWYLIYAYALGFSFAVSLALTALVRRFALRWGVLDHPGAIKHQKEPVPLLGGVAVFVTVYLMIMGNLFVLKPVQDFGIEWLEVHVFSFLGEDHRIKLTGIFAGGAIIFLLGIVDDIRVLSPWLKLTGQLAAATVLVLSGMHLDFFTEFWGESWFSFAFSAVMTVVWVVLVTNSLNLLDNMDGLCAGVSVISALSFFLCALHGEEAFICVFLMVFAGATAGFLFHNLNPARIYMGDAGAMFCGYMLATASVLISFYDASTPSRIAVAAPLLALSIPLFDTASVIFLRWRAGTPIMKGDRRHLSHRLVELGMTQGQAVEFILLAAALTGMGAALLRKVDRLGTAIIVAQAAGIYLLIVLLMRAGARRQEKDDRDPNETKS